MKIDNKRSRRHSAIANWLDQWSIPWRNGRQYHLLERPQGKNPERQARCLLRTAGSTCTRVTTKSPYQNPKTQSPLRQSKSRARSRRESLNGRLKKFAVLKNTFRQRLENHTLAFGAVCVTVQYRYRYHKNHGAAFRSLTDRYRAALLLSYLVVAFTSLLL
jgi:hypothetical protein